MGQTTVHEVQQPQRYRMVQGLTMLLVALLLVLALMLLVAGILLQGILTVLTAVCITLLATPLVLKLRVTPPVVVDDAGITLQPFIGSEQFVAWQDIVRVSDYALLPTPNQEVMQRALIGRKKYRPAQGITIQARTLPWPYRIVGWYALGRAVPAFALSNRHHENYTTLHDRIHQHTAEQWHIGETSEPATDV